MATLYHLDTMVGDLNIRKVIFDKFAYGLQYSLAMGGIVTDNRACDLGFAPMIKQIHLGDRKVEFTLQSCQQWFDPAAFFLQRSATGQEQVKVEYGNGHKILPDLLYLYPI